MGSATCSTITAQVASHVPATARITVCPTPTAVTVPSATVATDVSSELQVTLGSVASSGSTVAVSVPVWPTVSNSSVGSSRTSLTARATTSTSQAAIAPSTSAVTRVEPMPTPETSPSATVATDSFSERHTTPAPAAEAGETCTVSCAVSPTVTVTRSGSSVTFVCSGSSSLQATRLNAAKRSRQEMLKIFFITVIF